MNTITSGEALRQTIAALEIRHAQEQAALKAQLEEARQNLSPASLVQTTLDELSSASPQAQSELIRTTASLAAGFIAKRVVRRLSDDHSRERELGSELLTGVTTFIAQNPEVVRTIGNAFFSILRGGRPRR